MNYAKRILSRGYNNQTLSIDLAAGRMTVLALDAAAREYFVGGRALGLYLLHQKISARTQDRKSVV